MREMIIYIYIYIIYIIYIIYKHNLHICSHLYVYRHISIYVIHIYLYEYVFISEFIQKKRDAKILVHT